MSKSDKKKPAAEVAAETIADDVVSEEEAEVEN